jgi:transmembrane sensor
MFPQSTSSLSATDPAKKVVDFRGPAKPPTPPTGGSPPSPPGGEPPSDGRDPPPSKLLRRLSGAIGAVVCTVLTFLPFVGHSSTIELFTTDVGQQRSIPLGGGSDAQMNTDSMLRVQRDGNEIHAELLRGEVVFELFKNWKGHLLVSAGGLEIRDIGTVFSVHIGDDGKVRVTVIQGKVILSAAHIPETKFYATQQAVVDSRDHPMSLQTKSFPAKVIEDQLSWRYGELTFHCESINAAALEFNRYNRDKIEVVDTSTPERIEGMFMTTNPFEFVQSLQVLLPDLTMETVVGVDGHQIFRLRHLSPMRERHAFHRVSKTHCD